MAETVKGISIKLTLDGKELTDELNKIKSNLKEQQKDLKAINTSLKYDSSNLELWQKKQETLNKILEETKKKLQNQNEQLELAKKALEVGDISQTEFNKLRRNVTYTEADISKLNNQLEDTKEQISKLGSVNLSSLSKIGSSLTKYVTAPIIALGTALTTLTVKSASTADALGDTAKNLGISVASLQEWNYVAKMLAVDETTLQKALKSTNNMLAELATGGAIACEGALTELGISLDSLKNKNASETFALIRDKLSQVKDETIRVGLANDIFGEKIGTNLTQLISASSNEIDGFIEECIELGLITEEEVEASAKFNDELDKVKTQFQTLGVELAQVLLPILTEFLEKLKTEILPKLSDWINKIAGLNDNTKKTIIFIAGLVAIVGPVIKLITTMVPVVKGLAVALNGVGTSGFFAGAGISSATLGIGALIAILIMALTQSETFKEIITQIGELLMQLIIPIWDIITVIGEALMPIINMVMEVINTLIGLLTPLLDVLLIPIQAVLKVIGQILAIFNPILQVIANLIEKTIAPVLKVLYAVLEPIFTILNGIIECIQWILDHTVGWLLDIVDTVIGWFTGPTDSSQSNQTTNNQTTNNVTINTSSSEFDVDSINEALGGSYL